MGLFVAIIATASVPEQAWAHAGRRFEIVVQNHKLYAQGYISPTEPDDGGGMTRPYFNSLHDHWLNFAGTASATLPSFDIHSPGMLVGHHIFLELLGASKWVDPPMMPMPDTIPNLVPLDVGETITIERSGFSVDTDNLGTLRLVQNLPAAGAVDLDLLYQIDQTPSDVIYVLEWRLSTTSLLVARSGSIYTILSPDGLTPDEKLHHASLHLEEHLGLVPEPTSLALLGLGAAALATYGLSRRRAAAADRASIALRA